MIAVKFSILSETRKKIIGMLISNMVTEALMMQNHSEPADQARKHRKDMKKSCGSIFKVDSIFAQF